MWAKYVYYTYILFLYNNRQKINNNTFLINLTITLQRIKDEGSQENTYHSNRYLNKDVKRRRGGSVASIAPFSHHCSSSYYTPLNRRTICLKGNFYSSTFLFFNIEYACSGTPDFLACLETVISILWMAKECF